jgi:hypothetical protein
MSEEFLAEIDIERPPGMGGEVKADLRERETAEQAPDLREALERARDEGFSHVILDGKIVPADRCREKTISVRGEVIDLRYSGKAHVHSGNIQAVLAPDGFPLWASPAEPGPVHDITAAYTPCPRCTGPPRLTCRPWPIPATRAPASASSSPSNSSPAGGNWDIDTRTGNAIQRSLRCLGERGFALLTGRWRTLQHITASPSKIGDITRAALVLTHFEHG